MLTRFEQVRGVDGKMRDIQEGDRITAGAVLARVRQSDYQVKVKEAESQASEARSGIDVSKAQYQEALSGIASSKAQLAEAEAAYVKAKLDFDRAENLFASQQHDQSRLRLGQGSVRHDQRQGRRRALAGSGDPSQSRFRKSKYRRRPGEVKRRAGGRAGDNRFHYRTLHCRSPLNGVVLEKSIEKGTLVSSGDKGIRSCRHVVSQSGLRRGGRRRGGNETG